MENLHPKLRFPEFEGEWENSDFRSLVKLNQGLQISIEKRFTEYREGLYFYITNEFLKKDSDKKYYIENPPLSSICTADDILMTRTGNTGKVVTNVEGSFHNNFFRINYSKDITNKMFLYYFLTQQKTQNKIISLAGTSTIPDLNHSDFYSLRIVYPSLQEQTKIADFLGAVDKQLELLTTKKEKLQLYKKGVMQKLFSQEIRFKKEDNTNYPEWEEKTLGEFAIITAGGTPSTTKPEYWNGHIPWMNSGELNLKQVYEVENRITELGLIKSSTKLIPKHSILIGLAGQGKTRGTTAINHIELCTNQSIASILPNESFNSFYLYHNIDNRYNELRRLSSGDGGRGGLNLSLLKSLLFNIPSLEEQTKIADFLTAIDNQINSIDNQITKTENYKKGLLQQMFV